MRNRNNSLLCLILAFALCAGLLSFGNTASAAEPSPVGNSWEVQYSLFTKVDGIVNHDGKLLDGVIIYSLTAQQLDSGDLRVSLDFQTNGSIVQLFNAPKGDIINVDKIITPGERTTFTVDVPVTAEMVAGHLTGSIMTDDIGSCQLFSAPFYSFMAGYDYSLPNAYVPENGQPGGGDYTLCRAEALCHAYRGCHQRLLRI